MYKEQAFMEMLGNAIAEYDRILEDYAMAEAA